MSKHAATARRTRRVGWLVIAVAFTVVAATCIGIGLRHLGAGPSRPDSTSARLHASVDPPAAGTLGTPLVRAAPDVPPVHLSIPAIGVAHDLLLLGLNPDRTVEVPRHEDSASPGWFRLGPSPGQIGSSVILGHVDSLDGPAVFSRLRYLERGDRVDVGLEDGSVAHFRVRQVVTYPNARFPARKVYASHGYSALNLVTCGGTYDKARGGYQSNVVAYTRLVGTTPAAAA